MSLTKVTYSMIDGASVNVMDFGATGNGSTDDTNAIQAAINYCRAAVNSSSTNKKFGFQNQSPYRLFFPAGKYKITTPLVFDFIIDIVGETNGSFGAYATELYFANNTAGLVFLFSIPVAIGGPGYAIYNAATNTVTAWSATPGTPGQILSGSAATGWAVYSSVRNLRITGSGATGSYATTFSGIETRCQLCMDSVYVTGFNGHGMRALANNVYTVANNGGSFNGGFYRHCQFDANDGHGFFVDGGDANINTFVDCQFTNNKGWGVYDNSHLGNTYMGGQSSYNGQGSYGSFYDTGRCLFLNVYSEDGLRHSGRDSLFIGGVAEGGYEGYTAGAMPTVILGGFSGQIQSTPWAFRRLNETPETGINLVPAKHQFFSGTDADYMAGGASWGIQFSDDFPAGGAFGDVLTLFLLNETYAPFWASAPNASAYNYGTPNAIPGVLTSFSIALPYRRITQSDAIPTSGVYARGDIIFNIEPSAGGTPGWVCTTGGTAGSTAVFKAMANVAA